MVSKLYLIDSNVGLSKRKENGRGELKDLFLKQGIYTYHGVSFQGKQLYTEHRKRIKNAKSKKNIKENSQLVLLLPN